MKLHSLLSSVLTIAAAVGTASATTIGWNLVSGGGTPSTVSGSGYGNVRTFTADGVTVTVTAWGLTGNSATTLETAESGRWSVGMGICDRQEGAGCGSPQHQVDNGTRYDFMLFQFSVPVDPLSITIDPYGTYDRDVTYWVGNTAGSLNLAGTSLAGLEALGFSAAINDDSTASSNARAVALSSGVVNSVLLGARVAGDSAADYFKITAMCADAGAVPEPATYATLGLALVGLGLMRRGRARLL